MRKLYLRTMIVTTLGAMTCVMTATAQTPDLLPPKIVPTESHISQHPFRMTTKKQAHRKKVRRHQKRHRPASTD